MNPCLRFVWFCFATVKAFISFLFVAQSCCYKYPGEKTFCSPSSILNDDTNINEARISCVTLLTNFKISLLNFLYMYSKAERGVSI